ncbi:MAG: HD domain-containing protein [Clostridia bacterium]|nr:HD domain-containing protein [Clostridia bacterium]
MTTTTTDDKRAQGAAYFKSRLPIAALHAWSAWRREAEEASDASAFVQASNALSAAYAAIRDYASGREQLEAALAAAEDATVSAEDRAKVHLNLALTLYQTGYLDGALAAALEAWETCGLGATLTLAAQVQVSLSGIHIAREDWEAADRAARAACALADLTHATRLRSRALHNLAMVLLQNGRPEDAEDALVEAIRLANAEGQVADVASHLTELAHVKLRGGEPHAALELGTRALDTLWANVGVLDEAEVARLSRLFGLVASAAGEREQAIVWLNRAAAYYAQSGLMSAWKEVSELLGEVLSRGHSLRTQRLHIPSRTRDRIHYLTTLLSLSDSISSVQPRLGLHSSLVTHYALRLGEAMSLPSDELLALSHAGRFHDIGKIVVALPPFPRREDVIRRPEDERILLHPKTGHEMLAMFPLPAGVLETVRSHHERWDGQGYPDGLAGGAIPRTARVLAVANLYIALTYDVHPTPAYPHDEALRLVAAEAGAGLDPAAADAFLRLHEAETDAGKEGRP